MNDWKEQLKNVYQELQLKAKATKPKDKFDTEKNYKGRAGYNDVGIPLTSRAAKNKMKNKSTYAARARAKYYAAGSQLRNINDRRKAAAAERWGYKFESEKEVLSEKINYEPNTRPSNRFVDLNIPKHYVYYDVGIVDDGSVEVTPTAIEEKPKFRDKIEEEICRLNNKKTI